MQQHSFTIFNASAGSGKTYTLTKEYLKIILNAPQSDAYKQILAITFTNKAVEEMKTRIVSSLFEFSKFDTNEKSMTLLKDLSAETRLSIETIKDKSRAIIKNIIHNYSAFGISTIDKFTHKIIRTFAQDLNLPSNFEIVLDTDSLLLEAIESVIAKVGEDEQLTSFILEFTKNKTDEDKNWDISYELFEVAKLITNENNVQEIKAFENKNFEDFKSIRAVLENKVEYLKESSKQKGKQLKEFISSKGIDMNSFQVYFVNHLTNIENDEVKPKLKKYWEEDDIKVKKGVKDLDVIEAFKPEILSQLAKIYGHYGKIDFYKAFLQNINSLSLLNEVNKEYRRIQEEQNILSIADFNKIIYENIQGQPTPFIYERLGEKYRHYFIDEFQDTSEMQWKNLIPLIDNALASEENNVKGTLMLVGDPKQSIYRWRGGKAEQFIDLSKEDNPKDNNQNPFSNKDKKVQNLKTNYRSYSEVINFNNAFFTFLASKFQNPDYQKLYAETASQNINQKKGGFVNISFIQSQQVVDSFDENDEDISFKTFQYLEKTKEIIEKLLLNGFQYSDIVVLTRKKNEGVFLANYLTENNIPILSSETLLIQNATEVKLIISLLRFLNNNRNQEAKVYVLYFVGRYCQSEFPVHDFISTLINYTEVEIEEVFKKLGIIVSFKNCRTKSLYDVVEILVNAFVSNKANSSYLQYFMDLVLEKDNKARLGITEFLEYWDKTGFQKSIPSPEGTDAVRIMTIHKSKGLEFPVVIFPFAEEDFSKKIKNKLWIDFDESDEVDLPKAFVNSKQEVATYSEKAKEIFISKTEEELLDTINVLYVALTRAEEQLYVISNKLEKANGDLVTNNLSSYFIEFLTKQNKFNADDLSFQYGSNERVSKPIEKVNNAKSISLVTQKFPFENIKIAQNEALLWGSSRQDAINFGNILHEILAKIKTKNDINIALQISIENGLLSSKEESIIFEKLQEIVCHSELEEFFNDSFKILNEQIIIDRVFGNIKPDKIVIKDQKVFVLDYKTGEKMNSHINQINNYAQALERMNYQVTKKALVYIGEKIEVVFL